MTLKEVFESLNLTAYDLSVDALNMHVSTVSKAFVNHRYTQLNLIFLLI